MKKDARSVALVGLGVALALVSNTAALSAAKPESSVKKIFYQLLSAIQATDREAFVAEATDRVKKEITQKFMEKVHKLMGSRLKKGYEATYLGQLKKQEYQVHLWKVTFKDNGDDYLIRVALKDGKMATFNLW